MAAQPTSAITFQNFFTATLTATLTSTGLDVFLDTVPNGSEGFLVIDPDSATNREIIYYTSKTATKVTCPSIVDGRGQDDTTATSHESGTLVIMAPIAAYYETLLALFQTTPQGWTSLTGTFTAPVNNGNRSYTLSTSVDQSSILTPGSRFRSTRTVAAPTRCTSLNGTTQYYSKAAPAGMTFTDDFVAGAWVKMSSYPSGNPTAVISRYNGTSGWVLRIDPTGQVMLIGTNGAAGNFRYVQSYQSLPLNKWVHISAQLDMSAFTATNTTCYVTIDGVDVPALVGQGGTNPTALVQAGNLEVGSANAGTGYTFFPGKIAQAFVTSAKVTQATIRSNYMNQSISPTETSLISAYSFDNVLTDLNANANTLTANGSAVATNADSPFGGAANGTISSTLDYGIVTACTSSTVTVQVPEGCTIPTTGGITSAAYSSNKSPFGFPLDVARWKIRTFNRVDSTFGIGSSSTFYNAFPAFTLSLPVGAWQVRAYIPVAYGGTVAATILGRAYLTTETAVALGGFASTTLLLAETVSRFGGNGSSSEFNAVFTPAVDYLASSATTIQAGFETESAGGSFNVRHVGGSMFGQSYLEGLLAYL